MKYRKQLPQLSGHVCLTDGGIETVMVFQKGIDLPGFASFALLDRPDGDSLMRGYFNDYIGVAHRHGLGLLLESVTWRASAGWGRQLGYDDDTLTDINRRAIRLLHEVREENESQASPMPISGCIGPRGDGYTPSELMTAGEAEDYHLGQARVFAESEADMITALTLNYVGEALGIIRAAREAEMPVAISFTVETDGRLPSGDALGAAIERCDAETDGYPAYYMINCAHPTHFAETVGELCAVADRIGGVRANASKMSHAELEESAELDRGQPEELATDMMRLRGALPNMNVIGGCCGTDHEHIGQMAEALRAANG